MRDDSVTPGLGKGVYEVALDFLVLPGSLPTGVGNRSSLAPTGSNILLIVLLSFFFPAQLLGRKSFISSYPKYAIDNGGARE